MDDPFLFGGIAAANALSDVYAMGAEPRLALNIVCFPRALGVEVLKEILKGANAKLLEAGVLLAGGHSIEDDEVKFGLSITGFVHPDKVITNARARPGDALVLTKPLGTGVITSAIKKGNLKEKDATGVFASMNALNKAASLAMVRAGVNACTDVTGFGLVGHAMEMAKASGVDIVIRSKDVPIFAKALGLVKNGKNRPRTLSENMDFLKRAAMFADNVDEALKLLFFDPQTSGGLLISVASEKAGALMAGLGKSGVSAFIIGEAARRTHGKRIRVL